ncbi:MAG TPA: ABC transporter ATP-binding protein [Rhodocyclaceae bacterium]|nr:ABC transporter ATP-binding protein [Rhodocyclaceae bacterium]
MAEGLIVSLRQCAPISLDCELACAPGELIALVGPSGSGKTTVLRCIAGLAKPQQGRISCGADTWLDTASALMLPPQLRRVGMVFQSYSLLPHLTAQDNVAMALWHLPPKERSGVAQEWLARVHLHGLERRRPGELSGGQQQRVALARALARAVGDGSNAAVLLLDEPFSAVDQVTRRKLQQELARLRRELSIPIVLVTHDLDEARMLADRMVLLHHGASLQDGPPETVMTRPANAAVARLVGLTNLFEGIVVAAPDCAQTCLETLGLRLEVAGAAGWAPGTRVLWAVPPEGVHLNRRSRAAHREGINQIRGRIEDCVALGPFTHVTLRSAQRDARLAFSLPSHIARQDAIVPGAEVLVTLLPQTIHLMPWEGAKEF